MSSSVHGMFFVPVLCHGQLLILESLGTDSKIDLLDPPEVITKKIRKAEAAPRVIEDNGIIALVEFIFLPASALKGKKEFKVERRDDDPLIYSDIQQLKDDYAKDIVRIHNSSSSPLLDVDRQLILF